VVGEEELLAVICFDTPELSASIMVDSSAESRGPGEGVRKVNAILLLYSVIRKPSYMTVNKKYTYKKVINYLPKRLKQGL
jgi:hypothetical protein